MVAYKVDRRGRVRLPHEVLEQLGITLGEEVELHLLNDSIVIKRPRITCRFCGGVERLDPKLHICAYCAKLYKYFLRL